MKDRDVEYIAKVAHQVNRDYCKALGDGSQLPWDEAPDWQKESARAGVRAHMTNPHLTAKQSHEAWLEHRRKDGWTWGPVKDAAAKRHPSFKPYEDLPMQEQAKDLIFRAIVRELLEGLDPAPPGIA